MNYWSDTYVARIANRSGYSASEVRAALGQMLESGEILEDGRLNPDFGTREPFIPQSLIDDLTDDDGNLDSECLATWCALEPLLPRRGWTQISWRVLNEHRRRRWQTIPEPDAIRGHLDHLIAAGYLRRKVRTDELGRVRFSTTWSLRRAVVGPLEPPR